MDEPERTDIYGDELAPWFHLLTAPADYADEAAFALATLREHISGPLETMLELGSGGGNMASHLKGAVRLTLTDVSPAMLALSETLNPECEHLPATCAPSGSGARLMRCSSTTRSAT